MGFRSRGFGGTGSGGTGSGAAPRRAAVRGVAAHGAAALALAAAAAGLPQPAAGTPVAGTPVVLAPAALAPAPAGAWRWPLEGRGGRPPAVLEAFDPPARDWLPGHRGADLEAEHGDPLRAPASGTVAFAGVVVDRPVVTIDHGNGLRSSFEPVEGAPPAGTVVAAGEGVGRVGAGGHCGNRCIHWGLRLDGVYIDPLDTVADRRPSVLLPVPQDGP